MTLFFLREPCGPRVRPPSEHSWTEISNARQLLRFMNPTRSHPLHKLSFSQSSLWSWAFVEYCEIPGRNLSVIFRSFRQGVSPGRFVSPLRLVPMPRLTKKWQSLTSQRFHSVASPRYYCDAIRRSVVVRVSVLEREPSSANATGFCPYPGGIFDNSPTFEGWIPRIYGCIEMRPLSPNGTTEVGRHVRD